MNARRLGSGAATCWTHLLVVAVVAFAFGCQDATTNNQPVIAPARPRRTPPPTGVVRALPPHAIRSDGVGPYQLGQSVAVQLAELPSGPRLTLLDIPGVVHSNVMRAESGSILVGGGPTGLTEFVAVVAAEVARTESGLAVGAALPLVQKEMPFAQDRNHARDFRLKQVQEQSALKLVFDESKILRAFAVTSPSRSLVPVVASGCEVAQRIGGSKTVGNPAVAINGTDKSKSFIGEQAACLSSAGETLQWNNEEFVIRSNEAGRVALSQKVRGLQWAAPLSNGEHDDIVAVARTTVIVAVGAKPVAKTQ
jgi:hypothetical protein